MEEEEEPCPVGAFFVAFHVFKILCFIDISSSVVNVTLKKMFILSLMVFIFMLNSSGKIFPLEGGVSSQNNIGDYGSNVKAIPVHWFKKRDLLKKRCIICQEINPGENLYCYYVLSKLLSKMENHQSHQKDSMI